MGGRPERVSDREILQVLAETCGPVAGASEIADQLPIKYRGTVDRLEKLERRGLVARKKVGQSYAWWLTPAGCDELAAE